MRRTSSQARSTCSTSARIFEGSRDTESFFFASGGSSRNQLAVAPRMNVWTGARCQSLVFDATSQVSAAATTSSGRRLRHNTSKSNPWIRAVTASRRPRFAARLTRGQARAGRTLTSPRRSSFGAPCFFAATKDTSTAQSADVTDTSWSSDF